MPTFTYPDKNELAELKRGLKEGGITDPRALPMAIKAFSESEFTIEMVDSYAVLLREKLNAPAGDNGLGEHAELIRESYEGRGNPDARTRLVKAVGQAAADAAGRPFGLNGVTDFWRAGKLPEGFAPPKDKTTSNPWSDRYKGRAPADQERIRIIKTLGTRAATEMARSANVDIAGRPLRGQAA